jgi:hypothetical protein
VVFEFDMKGLAKLIPEGGCILKSLQRASPFSFFMGPISLEPLVQTHYFHKKSQHNVLAF